jgi:NADH-quinone oxidoreductase subunit N
MEILLMMKHELLLIVMLSVLLVIMISGKVTENLGWIKLFNSMMVINCLAGWFFNSSGNLFDQMFVNNDFIAFQKNILNAGTLIICLSSSGWLLKQRHVAEFYMLLLSSLTGMFLMISSSNFLMFYLALELSTIPIAALCNFNHDEKRSSEAAMKMIFSSAFSSCIMLLGISFLYGTTGSLNFNEFANVESSPIFLMGFVFFFSGLIFKLSVVPFHFWTADVYEGSPVAVTSFLSVISKGAMIFVFTSLLNNVFHMIEAQWYLLLCVLSILTMVTGNLFALRQENMKRFLAFSSITQVGFILIGISGTEAMNAATSVYFVVIYVFSNLAAFAVVTRIAELTGKENISQYRGLAKTNPALAWTMAISLFSLAGIPPTAGFFGKIFLITSGASKGNYILITIAALNMMVSLYYYLRVIRAMFMEKQDEIIPEVPTGNAFKVAMFVCIAGMLFTGFFGSVYQYIFNLSNNF